MAQQQSPWLEGAYGWNFGEGGWNIGMDSNLLKFSFMFDRNVDGVVGSLPAAVNSQAYFLTTDNRLYFAVGTTWFSSPTPKWFEFKDRSTGNTYQYNGTSANLIDSPTQLDSRLDAVELTVAGLGTAAFENVEFFATQSELDVVEASSQTYTDTFIQNLADDLDPAQGSNLVGYKSRTVAARLSDRVSVKDFGAVADGVTSDSVAFQAAADYCATNHKVLFIPAGIYYIPVAIKLDQVIANSYEIEGAGCGDAYWEPLIASGMAGTVIKTAGNDVFYMQTPYPTSSIIISKMRVIGDSVLKTGFLLNFTEVTRQIKNLWLDQITASYCGGILKAFSSTNFNLGYLTMTKCYTWQTNKVVHLDAVPTTIWTIRDSLFHGTVDYALHLGMGAELSISDTWFESGIPASIYKPSTNFLFLSLHNVYFETASAPSNPGYTTIVAGENSHICLSGKTNLPGSFLTGNPFTLSPQCTFANFTANTATIRSLGGAVLTPNTVRLHPKFSHQVHVPVQNVTPCSYGDLLYTKSIAGPSLGGVNYASIIPDYLSTRIAPATGLSLCSGAFSSSPTYADDRLVCIAFAYESASVNNGLASGSTISIGGSPVALNTGFTFPNDLNTSDYYCIEAVPLPAGSAPTAASVSIRNSIWHSFANAMVPEELATIAQCLPLPVRKKSQIQTIAAAGNFVFNFQAKFELPFFVTADITVDNGTKGFYKVQSSGIATNGSKTRVTTNGITDVNVLVAAADGAHVDILSVTVTNNTASPITVSFVVSF